jgi:hypothetical protein
MHAQAVEITGKMVIGTTVHVPLSANRVGGVGHHIPSAFTSVIMPVGMIEALTAVKNVMTILGVDLAGRHVAAVPTTAATTTGTATAVT